MVLAGCQLPLGESGSGTTFKLSKVGKSISGFTSKQINLVRKNEKKMISDYPQVTSLSEMVEGAKSNIDLDIGFSKSLKQAIETHPSIIAKAQRLEMRLNSISALETTKDLRVTGSFLGGLQDVSDRTAGMAVVLNANRLLFDGGLIDSKIAAQQYLYGSEKFALEAAINRQALELSSTWVNLERFETLERLLDRRLSVLEPLIVQLEKVAEAGIGDVTRVTAAQKIVSEIRETKVEVEESLEQQRVRFRNAFGDIPESASYDASFISTNVPNRVDEEMINNSPAIKSDYSAYLAAEAGLAAVKAEGDFEVAFEARATTPVGGGGYSSDESIGLVARKTLFNKKQLTSLIAEAEAGVNSAMANLQSTYRRGKQEIRIAEQNIASKEKVILIAKDTAKVTSDQILYLRKQLIIGGSTLDSVLSAEARLYDAEAKEVNFLAERRMSELLILATLGILGKSLDIAVESQMNSINSN